MVYFEITKSQVESSILDLKKNVTIDLSNEQEKWRAWKSLNLDATLNLELEKFAKMHSLSSLTVAQKANLKRVNQGTQIVLPEDSGATVSDRTVNLKTVTICAKPASLIASSPNKHLVSNSKNLLPVGK